MIWGWKNAWLSHVRLILQRWILHQKRDPSSSKPRLSPMLVTKNIIKRSKMNLHRPPMNWNGIFVPAGATQEQVLLLLRVHVDVHRLMRMVIGSSKKIIMMMVVWVYKKEWEKGRRRLFPRRWRAFPVDVVFKECFNFLWVGHERRHFCFTRWGGSLCLPRKQQSMLLA